MPHASIRRIIVAALVATSVSLQPPAAIAGAPSTSASPQRDARFSFFPAFPDARWHFEPLAAYADVRFELLDRRPEAEKQFRRLTSGEPRYAYGDDQFFPPRMRVVATHFADAFPRDGEDAQLVIERLEIIDYVPRSLGDPPRLRDAVECRRGGHPILVLYCVGVSFVANAVTSRDENSVACYLSGSYAGIAFSARAFVTYSVPGSPDNKAAVASVLLTATTEAIKEVSEERSYRATMTARRSSVPTPPLPLPASLTFAPKGFSLGLDGVR